MPAALVVRFRPAGPWRPGPDNGAKDRTDRILHSDSLFSAVTHAMRELGWLSEWISATAEAPSPAVRLSSCYPYTGRTLLIQPPKILWPLAETGKVRWKSARFIPTSLVSALLRDEELREDQWAVDPVSECLLPVTKNGPVPAPFRIAHRTLAAVDRVSGASEIAHSEACLQFTSGAGMWFAASFGADEDGVLWSDRIRSAARLLADTGVGGGRSRGWGRSEEPRFETADLTRMLTGTAGSDRAENAWWLISLFSPSESDTVDWKHGQYRICTRAGRMENATAWGELKRAGRMVSEGSVLLCQKPPAGTAVNVADPSFPHPVYRSGIALAIPIPWKQGSRLTPLETRREPAGEGPAAEEAAREEMQPQISAESLARESEPPSAPEIEPPAPDTPVEEPPEPEPPGEEPPPEVPPTGDPDPQPPPVREPTPDAISAEDTTEGQPS